jgi:hypothetical protein
MDLLWNIFPGKMRPNLLLSIFSLAFLMSLTSCDWFLSFPKEGSRAPISHNPVLQIGERFGDICTMNVPDHLHRESFSHAIYHHRAVLVFFGAPIHCTPCVHEDRIVQGLQGVYHGDMAFIHIDDYEDSEQKVVHDWRVHGEPWVAVINQEGIISHVIPGDANYYSLNKMIKETLR